jgi:hypothetical protein
MEQREQRTEERFVAVAPLEATYGGTAVRVINLSAIGAQIEHASLLRLGSAGRFMLRHGNVAMDVKGVLVWSRLHEGLYRSGVHIQTSGRDYAEALEELIESGALKRDPESLNRKR